MDRPVRTPELAVRYKYRQEGMAIERERILGAIENAPPAMDFFGPYIAKDKLYTIINVGEKDPAFSSDSHNFHYGLWIGALGREREIIELLKEQAAMLDIAGWSEAGDQIRVAITSIKGEN